METDKHYSSQPLDNEWLDKFKIKLESEKDKIIFIESYLAWMNNQYKRIDFLANYFKTLNHPAISLYLSIIDNIKTMCIEEETMLSSLVKQDELMEFVDLQDESNNLKRLSS